MGRKTGGTNKKYSAEFKISVILDMRKNYLNQRETVRKYWKTQNRIEEDLYINTLKRWHRIFLEEGAEGLMKERRGKNCKEYSKIGRPKKKLNKTIEKDLIEENKQLRMEIEYLKKLSALVLAEERKSGKKRK